MSMMRILSNIFLTSLIFNIIAILLIRINNSGEGFPDKLDKVCAYIFTFFSVILIFSLVGMIWVR